MKILTIIILLCLGMVWADEVQFLQDLTNVYTQNIQTSDTDCRPPISRIRKLFYDGTTWNLLIPEAQKYQRPTDAISLDFKKNYQSAVIIHNQAEDFAHVLGAWDGYMYSPVTQEIPNLDAWEQYWNTMATQDTPTRSSPDLCSWLGDLGSALAQAYKQQISMQKAFSLYASDSDLRANLAAFHLWKMSQPYMKETYKFPIANLVTQHYQDWHFMPDRQKFLAEYFATMQLVWEGEHFTQQSRQNFLAKYLSGIKIAAWAYYYSGQRVSFSDADAQTILNLYLDRLEVFYCQQNL